MIASTLILNMEVIRSVEIGRPVVPLTCTICSNVFFISPILAGILPKPGGVA